MCKVRREYASFSARKVEFHSEALHILCAFLRIVCVKLRCEIEFFQLYTFKRFIDAVYSYIIKNSTLRTWSGKNLEPAAPTLVRVDCSMHKVQHPSDEIVHFDTRTR